MRGILALASTPATTRTDRVSSTASPCRRAVQRGASAGWQDAEVTTAVMAGQFMCIHVNTVAGGWSEPTLLVSIPFGGITVESSTEAHRLRPSRAVGGVGG